MQNLVIFAFVALSFVLFGGGLYLFARSERNLVRATLKRQSRRFRIQSQARDILITELQDRLKAVEAVGGKAPVPFNVPQRPLDRTEERFIRENSKIVTVNGEERKVA